MGEVYRARDTRLNRDVALKVLPPAFANDPDRLARFTREAQVLASLNHTNIASIYGMEGAALVMELVEGQDCGTPSPRADGRRRRASPLRDKLLNRSKRHTIGHRPPRMKPGSTSRSGPTGP